MLGLNDKARQKLAGVRGFVFHAHVTITRCRGYSFSAITDFFRAHGHALPDKPMAAHKSRTPESSTPTAMTARIQLRTIEFAGDAIAKLVGLDHHTRNTGTK